MSRRHAHKDPTTGPAGVRDGGVTSVLSDASTLTLEESPLPRKGSLRTRRKEGSPPHGRRQLTSNGPQLQRSGGADTRCGLPSPPNREHSRRLFFSPERGSANSLSCSFPSLPHPPQTWLPPGPVTVADEPRGRRVSLSSGPIPGDRQATMAYADSAAETPLVSRSQFEKARESGEEAQEGEREGFAALPSQPSTESLPVLQVPDSHSFRTPPSRCSTTEHTSPADSVQSWCTAARGEELEHPSHTALPSVLRFASLTGGLRLGATTTAAAGPAAPPQNHGTALDTVSSALSHSPKTWQTNPPAAWPSARAGQPSFSPSAVSCAHALTLIDSSITELTSFSAGFPSGDRQEGSGSGGGGCWAAGRTATAAWVPQYGLPHFVRHSSLPSLGDGDGSMPSDAPRRPRVAAMEGHNRYGGYRHLDGHNVPKPLHLQLAQQRQAAGFNVYGDPIEETPRSQKQTRSRGARLRCYYQRNEPQPPSGSPCQGGGTSSSRGRALWPELLHGVAWLLPFGLAAPFAIVLVFVLVAHYSTLRLCGEKCHCTVLDSFLYVVTMGWFYYIPAVALTPALFLMFLKAEGMHESLSVDDPERPSRTGPSSPQSQPPQRNQGTGRCGMDTVARCAGGEQDGGSPPRCGQDAGSVDGAASSLSIQHTVVADDHGSGSSSGGRRAPLQDRGSAVFSSASLHTASRRSLTCPGPPTRDAALLATHHRSGEQLAASAKTTGSADQEEEEEEEEEREHRYERLTALAAEAPQEPLSRMPGCLFANDYIDGNMYTEVYQVVAQGSGHRGGCVPRTVDCFLPPPVLAQRGPHLSTQSRAAVVVDWSLPSTMLTVARSHAFWILLALRYVCIVLLDTQLPTTQKVPFLLYGILRACVLTLPVFLYACWLFLPLLALPCLCVDYFSGLVLVLFNTTGTAGSADFAVLAVWPLLVHLVEKVLVYLSVGAIKRSALTVLDWPGSSLGLALKALLSTCFAGLFYATVFTAAVLLCAACSDGALVFVPFLVVFLLVEVLVVRTVLVERGTLWLLGAFDRLVLRRVQRNLRRDERQVDSLPRDSIRATTSVRGPPQSQTPLSSTSSPPAPDSTIPVVTITGTSFASVSTRVRGAAALMAAAALGPLFVFSQWPRDFTRPSVQHTILDNSRDAAGGGAAGQPVCRGYAAAAGEGGLVVHWVAFVVVVATALVAELVGTAVAHLRDGRWQRALTAAAQSAVVDANGKAREEVEAAAAGNTAGALRPSSLCVTLSSAPLVVKDVLLLVALGWFLAALGVSTALMAVPVWRRTSE